MKFYKQIPASQVKKGQLININGVSQEVTRVGTISIFDWVVIHTDKNIHNFSAREKVLIETTNEQVVKDIAAKVWALIEKDINLKS